MNGWARPVDPAGPWKHIKQDKRMDPASLNPRSTPDLPPAETEELKVERYRKLGYTSAEVQAVYRKLGQGADTNAVLGELVRKRNSSTSSNSLSNSDDWSLNQRDPLVRHSSHKVAPRQADRDAELALRPIVIDGSNVAMSHGNKEVFSCSGIQLAVNFFLDRGHDNITVFVPTWRKEQPSTDAPITDQHFLTALEKQKIVVFTPSRRVGGKRVVCYDDRFIVKLAHESDGVIVSNDTYRDLQGENPEWKKCIEERLLMYSFVNDRFMPPDDPLGRHGPSLSNFLRKRPLLVEQNRQLCPYNKKCTYGIKCKYYHPERVNQSLLSVADELREKAQISSGKEDRNGHGRLTQPQAGHPSLPADCDGDPLYWDDPWNGQRHKDWPGPHLMPSSHFYPDMLSQDSGLGSFEGQCSDSLNKSHRPRGRTPPKHTPSPPSVHRGNADSKPHPHFDAYPSALPPPHHQMFPRQPHSLPSHPRYNGAAHHHLQQNYWSDPLHQGLPPSTAPTSLPHSIYSSYSHNSSLSYADLQYNSWGQQQSNAEFDKQRPEIRKDLLCIFSPEYVDAVMGKFPHQMNKEKLAAEIVTMMAQSDNF